MPVSDFANGKSTTFTQSSPEQQFQLLENWRTSTIALRRKAIKAINSICQATYYANISMHKNLGYDGPHKGLLEQLESFSEMSYTTYLSQQPT